MQALSKVQAPLSFVDMASNGYVKICNCGWTIVNPFHFQLAINQTADSSKDMHKDRPMDITQTVLGVENMSSTAASTRFHTGGDIFFRLTRYLSSSTL